MKLIHLFLFSVFVGVAFGAKKLECLNREITTCTQILDFKNGTKDACVQMPEVADCYNAAVKKCNDEGKEIIQKILKIAEDLCNHDSEMYKDFVKHIQCLSEPTFLPTFSLNCLFEFGKEIKELSKPDMDNLQEYAKKLEDFICPNREKIVPCAYGQIKAECGGEAEKFARNFVGPFDDLLKESCTDSATIPSMSMAIIFLQLLIAFFSSRRIF